ncbi:hypothetical protein GCM10010413_29950 [Promicromonospora sukumoe]
MNRSELRSLLVELGIPHDAYELDGDVRDESFVLGESYGTWFVYYSERGLRSRERKFTSESDACEYLLRVLRRGFRV